MTKLNDTQSIILSAASQRERLSLYPLPQALAEAGARSGKVIASLVKAGFAEERETTDSAEVQRYDGDIGFGMFATEKGLQAIGIGEKAGPDADAPVDTPKPARQTKATLVLGLIEREEGATLAEMVEATGWLPHTTRAVLTGLRKKGHEISRDKRGDETCYRIGKAV